MNLKAWYQKRGIRFILQRAQRLTDRYGFRSQKSITRIEACMEALRSSGCCPTFAVPGIVVERNLPFIQQLQEVGLAEIAVHGYNHVDMQSLRPEEASRQLQHAAEIFRAGGLEVRGFRCPYLSASDALIQALPAGLFEYSSNRAIQWPVGLPSGVPESLLYETIKSFYAPLKSDSSLCLPWSQDGLVEIPVCVPDDLQLHDGLGFGLEQVSQIWVDILHQTHRRGEVYNLMFHPELADFCNAPFLEVLRAANRLRPQVWFARLRDVSAWWREKSTFRIEAEFVDHHFVLKFNCTPRATLLCRGFEPDAPASHWDGNYYRLSSYVQRFDTPVLPFIGLPPYNVPLWVTTDLQRMGYIIDTGDTAQRCSLYIDGPCLSRFCTPHDLIAYIESTQEPLIRFWPWPDGARSALCITGDLDALSFFDYAVRLLKK